MPQPESTKKWFFLSFATETAFLAEVLEGRSGRHAIDRARKLAIYPGAEAIWWEVGTGDIDRLPVELRGRLFTASEVEQLGGVDASL